MGLVGIEVTETQYACGIVLAIRQRIEGGEAFGLTQR
jgi:hypothetical protein